MENKYQMRPCVLMDKDKMKLALFHRFVERNTADLENKWLKEIIEGPYVLVELQHGGLQTRHIRDIFFLDTVEMFGQYDWDALCDRHAERLKKWMEAYEK